MINHTLFSIYMYFFKICYSVNHFLSVLVVPLYSAHFPNPEGVIAPGMTCSYSVQFLPDSLADFDDQLKVPTYKQPFLFAHL